MTPKALEYADFSVLQSKLARHRADGLVNLAAAGQLSWADLGDVLDYAERDAPRSDERAYAARAAACLRERGLS